MLYNDRAAFILQQLQLKSTVKVTEIAKSLNVSVDTVKRWKNRGSLNACTAVQACRIICWPSVISAGVKSSILKKNAGRRLKRWNICARAA